MTESEAKRFADAYHDCKLVADSIVDDETFQKADFGLVFYYMNEILDALSKIQQYRAIGTVEELRELKEKATAIKPIPIDYEKYTEVVKNVKFLRGAYWCPNPNCGHAIRSGDYCNDCGQKLDWSEGKE